MDQIDSLQHKKFFGEVALVALAQWLPKIEGFVILPFIVGLLGVGQYGIWSQISVTIALVYPFSALGICTAMKRFLPGKTESEVKNDFWAAVLFISITSFVLAILLFILSPIVVSLFFKSAGALLLLRISAILIPLTILNQLFLDVFIIFGQSKRYSILILGKETVEMVLLIYFLLHGGGLMSVVIISIFSLLVVNLIAFFMYLKKIGLGLPKMKTLSPYLELGIPVFLSGISYWFITFSSRYIIGYFLNIKLVGVYSCVYMLTTIVPMLSGPIWLVLLPAISKFWENGQINNVKKYLEYSFKYFLILCVPAVFGLTVLGRQFLQLLVGKDFIGYWFLIPIIGIALMIYQKVQLDEYVLILAKKSSIILRYTVLSAIVSVIFGIMLVPLFGLTGAALSNLFAYIFYAIIIFFESRKYLTYNFDVKFLFKSVASSLIMGFPIFLLNPQGPLFTVLSIIVGALAYVGLLFLMGGINIEEVKILFKSSKLKNEFGK